MDSNHLTYFKIENFKRFESFEMSNIGQFNLLVGDNNVGKTSVLEALLVDDSFSNWLINLYTSLFLRKLFLASDFSISKISSIMSNKGSWNYLLRDITLPLKFTFSTLESIDAQSYSIKLVEKTELDTEDIEFLKKDFNNGESQLWCRYFTNDKHTNTLNLNKGNLSTSNKAFPLFTNNLGYTEQLVRQYSVKINSDKTLRRLFDDSMKLIIPQLEETRIHNAFDTDCIGIVLKDDNETQPLTRFGDGSVKFARVIIGLISNMHSGRILIDEIETGLHFTRLKQFWKIVISLCKQFNIQLFATTHSLECQKYFVEALTELGEEYQKDARNISLVENSAGEVKSVTFDFEGFEFALNIGANTR